jgi:hypothetical protein
MNEIEKLETKPWKKLAEGYRKIFLDLPLPVEARIDEDTKEEFLFLEVERESLIQKERIEEKKNGKNS